MSLTNVFKGSLIITTITNTVKAFFNAYKNSGLKNVVFAVGICFKESKTYSVLSCYANKKPYYRYSVVYGIIMAIAGLFDRLFGFINRLFTALFKGSVVSAEVNGIMKANVSKKLYGFGLLFMSIPIGSIISMIFAGSVSALNMSICWVVFVFGFVLVLIASCRTVFKNSIVFRAVKGFFDLIR